MSNTTTPLFFPDEYNNFDKEVINKPKFKVGPIFIKEGDKIKKNQDLLELYLIEPEESIYYTITNQSGKKAGWLS